MKLLYEQGFSVRSVFDRICIRREIYRGEWSLIIKSYCLNDKDRVSLSEEWKNIYNSINSFVRDLEDRVVRFLCLKYRKQRHGLERFISVYSRDKIINETNPCLFY